MPTAVIPTWTVEITRTGSSISRSAASAPLPPRARSAPRRAVTIEYSPITKKAFARDQGQQGEACVRGRPRFEANVQARVFELNLPNVLTLLRILLVPVLVAALVQEGGGGDTLAAAVFVLASFTDALDGWIARRQKSVSTFGKLMDPLADKLLVTAALVSLVSLDRLSAPGWRW